MDESVKSGARLEVSVSFGRFEKDALSWEKWSSFSPNKYLEEAGNLSTPGSVAQKKAYFEAHYKKIAARKAEELEKERLMDPVIPSPDMSSKEDCVANSSENDSEIGLSNGESLVEEAAQETCVTVLTNGAVVKEAKDDIRRSPKGNEQGACTSGSIRAITLEAEKEDVAVAVTCGSSAAEESRDEFNVNAKGPESNISKNALLVGSETLQDSQHSVRKSPGRKNEVLQSSVLKKENSKLNACNMDQKVTPTKKERISAGMKKNAVPPTVKPLQTSTPRRSKPSSMLTPSSASKILKKQVNGSQLPKSKNSPVGESKREASTSLHMSLSLGSANSSAAISTTRKSLIMEKMGDKDIVKRAFKTFQIRTSESTTDEKPSPVKHMSSTALKPKVSASHTPTQGNEGLGKNSEKRRTQRSPSGTRSNPLPKGSSLLDRKNNATFSPTTGLKSDENAEKRIEFLKKLEAKSIAREAENAQRIAKLKSLQARVENEIRQQATLRR